MKTPFDAKKFLETIDGGRKIITVKKKEIIFEQGDVADSIFYLQEGKVMVTVTSKRGKEATIGILGEGKFFGEGVLAGQAIRMATVTALTSCKITRITKATMMQTLHREPVLADLFVMYLLRQNRRFEEDLVDHLFNSSEKRLARILLLLGHFGKEETSEAVVPNVSQETLAEMIGTTRARVSFFLNRFKKMGFIHYQQGEKRQLQVHSSLLNIILHD